jgi:hypothetical protein
MAAEEHVLDINALSAAEFSAETILRRFPQATLEVQETASDKIFEIHFKEKILLKLDKRGARYFFPTRRKRSIKWNMDDTNGLLRVIDFILRDLAEAGYEVLSTANKQLTKRPIHVSRYTQCPICKEKGGIKLIFRGDSLTEENSRISTPVSPAIEINSAEIKCTLCDWIGVREELARKPRKPRYS